MSTASVTPTRLHFNAARLRSHTWDQLKLAALALDEGRGSRDEVGALLKDLLTIELYWAYPGRTTVKRLQDKKSGKVADVRPMPAPVGEFVQTRYELYGN